MIQEELLVEGFRKKSDMLKNEISKLREEVERTRKKPSLFANILDTVGDAFIMILPGAGKLCGAGLKVLSSFM
ncbi:Guanylate-binding protein 4 [Apodemus speciosus]|uniref:Guanylate-binding protein 4 n=1 Tax=Apodemus speciosus TaxID=105296 RepID=A0ABQ0FVT1_APOSI